MKKLDWVTVAEIALGVIIGASIVAVLHHLFGGWLAKHGMELTGVAPNGTEISK